MILRISGKNGYDHIMMYAGMDVRIVLHLCILVRYGEYFQTKTLCYDLRAHVFLASLVHAVHQLITNYLFHDSGIVDAMGHMLHSWASMLRNTVQQAAPLPSISPLLHSPVDSP